MAIDNIEVIDFSGIDKQNGDICLTISDHLDWNDAEQKLEILASKLNAYIQFITSGQVYEAHRDQEGRHVRVQVLCLHPPPKSVDGSLLSIRNQLASQHIGFEVKIGPFESGFTRPYDFTEA